MNSIVISSPLAPYVVVGVLTGAAVKFAYDTFYPKKEPKEDVIETPIKRTRNGISMIPTRKANAGKYARKPAAGKPLERKKVLADVRETVREINDFRSLVRDIADLTAWIAIPLLAGMGPFAETVALINLNITIAITQYPVITALFVTLAALYLAKGIYEWARSSDEWVDTVEIHAPKAQQRPLTPPLELD